jgi:putative ABC transport system permease protein
VVVSEPFANRHEIHAGGTVRLRTDRGEEDFRVAGVFYDYGSTAGVVAMARSTFERHWEDRAVSGLALEAAPGQDLAALIEALRLAAGGEDLLIRSNRGLREASMAIFDRTFAITSVLRLAIVAVAFLGVMSALMALELDRTREIATLRALGCAPGQVWRIVTGETALMGALAGLLALPVGIGLAAALIHVVNRRSFGWTMPLDLSPRVLLEGLGIAVAAAVLAGLYPAWRMASAPPAEALRDE